MLEVAMINDCAHVGETLLRYLPSNIKKKHIKRTRSMWSKSFGLAYKIMKTKADIYHVNYLLQDCYIAAFLMKRPLIGHAHGSDLRIGLKHSLWKKIVRYNLKHCDKVIVSTPDILEMARQQREDTEYLPNPVDTQIFSPTPLPSRKEKIKVLIAGSSDWNIKGIDIAIKALSKIKDQIEVSIIRHGRDFHRTMELARTLGLKLHILEKTTHERMREYYWNSNVVIDQFKLGSLGMISLEAIACGRPVITYVSSEYPQYKDFPLKDVNTEEEIAKVTREADTNLWRKEYSYLEKNHKPEIIVEKLLSIYNDVI
ncbi:MAG: glycosyltransferase [Candidatus Bathyarchaeia archaeon]